MRSAGFHQANMLAENLNIVREEVLSEVHLFHGRTDSLIPYTETLLANTLLPRDKIVSSTITGLFEHSERGNRLTSVFQEIAEATSLIRALSRVLSIV